MEQLTGSKLGKEYDKEIYRHPAYLTYMYIVQNAGLDESQAGTRLPGEISTTSDMQMTLMAESEEELKKNLA